VLSQPKELLDHLARVGDHHHALGRGGDDLLAQQRAAAALDEGEVGVDLVGAVDDEVERADRIERLGGEAERGGEGGGCLGGRDAAEPQPLVAGPGGEMADHDRGGRAGAEAEAHAVPDHRHGSPRSGVLGGVVGGGIGHGGTLLSRVAAGIGQFSAGCEGPRPVAPPPDPRGRSGKEEGPGRGPRGRDRPGRWTAGAPWPKRRA